MGRTATENGGGGDSRPEGVLSLGGRIPLVVGVVGHRDLRPEDVGPLRTRVRSVLVDLVSKCGRTPILLLCGLAEGADRLVAEEALQIAGDGGAGDPPIRLVSVLPMPVSAYAADFVERGSVERLEALRSRAATTIALPVPEGVDVDALTGSPDLRTDRYVALAEFLLSHSHVLVALWNGKPGGGRGGTEFVVDRFVRGRPLSVPPGLRLEVIPTARRSDPETVVRPVPGLGHFDGTLSEFERFNKAVEAHGRHLQPVATTWRDLGFGEDAPEDMVPLAESFGAAEALSIAVHRRRYLRAATALFLFAFAGVVAVETALHWVHLPGGWILVEAYVVALIGATAYWMRLQARGTEERMLMCRSFAEALRVQVHWRAAGLHANVADEYDPMHLGEISWVRSAVQGLCALAPVARGGTTPARVRRAAEAWVKPQWQWFRKKVERHRGLTHRLEWLNLGALLLHAALMGLVVVLAGAASIAGRTWSDAERDRADMVVWFAIVVLACAGLAHAWRTLMAYKEIARRYAAAVDVYDWAARRLTELAESEPSRMDVAADVLRGLGRSALVENASWLQLRRDRPLQVVRP